MTGKESKKTPSRPAQVTVILRLVAGAYLVYLAFGLGKEALSGDRERLMLQLGCMVLFLAVGAVLGSWSIYKLIKGEYIHPGEDAEDAEGAEEADNAEDAEDAEETGRAEDAEDAEETEDAGKNKTEQ